MKDLVYLVKIDTKKNHNVFYKMIRQNDIFIIEYGRIGATPVVMKRPLFLWNETYEKKISEGYVDRTDMVTVKCQKETEYKEIEDEVINHFINYLLQCANIKLKENYNISYKDVSQKMIDSAQDILFSMANNPTLEYIRKKLPELYVVIPRKMKDVADSLPKDEAQIPDVLLAEQNLLDIMTAKVLDDVDRNEVSDERKTILEAYNLDISEVTDKEEISLIKKYLSNESMHMFRRAFRVKNKKTDDRFYQYMKKYGYTEKNIHYYYHGSVNENYWGLITQGQKLNPKAVITGKMFGYGLYYASRAKKSIQYTSLKGSYWKKGNLKTAYLAVYKVLYKNPLHVEVWKPQYETLTGNLLYPHDALFAHAGASLINDEIIVYHENQATLQYIIELGIEGGK